MRVQRKLCVFVDVNSITTNGYIILTIQLKSILTVFREAIIYICLNELETISSENDDTYDISYKLWIIFLISVLVIKLIFE